jgi:glutathione synthase/RimK-type ligase-like ATP-grasp enzyme
MVKNNQRILLTALKSISKLLNIQIIIHSDGWIIELQKNHRTHYIYGYNFPNNNAASSRLCDDKSAVYEVLTKHRLPAVPHFYFMNPKNPNSWNKDVIGSANALLKKYKNIVVKPNNGTGGDYVFLVNTPAQLLKAVNQVFGRFDYLTISPFVKITNEYRLIMLNNKPLLIYEKIKQQNEWRHNLQLGAKPVIVIDKSITKKLTSLSQKAAMSMNIKFCSIDIVKVNDQYKVLEINSGVMLEKFAKQSSTNYSIALNIYKQAIQQIKF